LNEPAQLNAYLVQRVFNWIDRHVSLHAYTARFDVRNKVGQLSGKRWTVELLRTAIHLTLLRLMHRVLFRAVVARQLKKRLMREVLVKLLITLLELNNKINMGKINMIKTKYRTMGILY
jgi:hypothetical protein